MAGPKRKTAAGDADDRWYTVTEAMAYLGCGRMALYRYVQRGQLPAYRLGARPRYKRTDLDALVLPEAAAAAGWKGDPGNQRPGGRAPASE